MAVVHVAVARSRHLVAPPGVRLHRSAVLLDNVRWNLGPPRVRYEDAVLDAAGPDGAPFELGLKDLSDLLHILLRADRKAFERCLLSDTHGAPSSSTDRSSGSAGNGST